MLNHRGNNCYIQIGGLVRHELQFNIPKSVKYQSCSIQHNKVRNVKSLETAMHHSSGQHCAPTNYNCYFVFYCSVLYERCNAAVFSAATCIMDRSWMNASRISEQYEDGVEL